MHNTDEQRNHFIEVVSAISPSKSSKRGLYVLHEDRQTPSVSGTRSHGRVYQSSPTARSPWGTYLRTPCNLIVIDHFRLLEIPCEFGCRCFLFLGAYLRPLQLLGVPARHVPRLDRDNGAFVDGL
jgi:hypothetical protein